MLDDIYVRVYMHLRYHWSSASQRVPNATDDVRQSSTLQLHSHQQRSVCKLLSSALGRSPIKVSVSLHLFGMLKALQKKVGSVHVGSEVPTQDVRGTVMRHRDGR